MPLQKFLFKPGINRDGTSYSDENAWYGSNKVRFKMGLPERIGGWTQVSDPTVSVQVMDGTCRALFSWRDFVANIRTLAGTHQKLYSSINGIFSDITAFRSEVDLPNNPITSVDTSSDITITDPMHGAGQGDFVYFENFAFSLTNGILPSDINSKVFRIISITDEDNYKITLGVVASGNGSFGSTVGDAKYLIHSGNDLYSDRATVAGTAGWGTGTWGGVAGASPGAPGTWGHSLPPNIVKYADELRVWGLDNLGENIVATPKDGPVTYMDLRKGGSPEANRCQELSKVTNLGSDQTAVTTDSADRSTSIYYKANPCRRAQKTLVAPVTGNIVALGCTKEIPPIADANPGATTYDSFYRKVVVNNSGITAGYATFESAFTASGSKRVRIYSEAHGLQSGDYVTLSIAADLDGIPKEDLSKPLRVESIKNELGLDNNNYFIVQADGTTGASTGGVQDLSPNALTIKMDSGIDPMLVRWSSTNTALEPQPLNWETHEETTSGDYPLSSGSYIVTGLKTRQEILIWTDTSLYSMSYVGPPSIFAFNMVSNDISIAAQNASIVADNGIVYWMGDENFYAYTGSVQVLPCTVLDFVFDNIDQTQIGKVFAFENSRFSEVTWLYPSSIVNTPENNYLECDRYVTFNYKENVWYFGTFADYSISDYLDSGFTIGSEQMRTAWDDSGLLENPISAYQIPSSKFPANSEPSLTHETVQSALMYQEDGESVVLSDGSTSRMDSMILSGDFELGQGDDVNFVSKVIPDIKFRGTGPTSTDTSFKVTLNGKNYPQSPATPASTSDTVEISVQTTTGYKNVRTRAREMTLMYSSSSSAESDYGWRAGATRLEMKPDGKR